MLNALLAGQIDFGFFGLTPVLGHIKQGTVKALAFGGDARSPVLPDVPTLAESGFIMETGGWFGLYARSGTSPEVLQRLSLDVRGVLRSTEFRAKYILGVGLEPIDLPVEEAGALLNRTRTKYADLFRKVSIDLSK